MTFKFYKWAQKSPLCRLVVTFLTLALVLSPQVSLSQGSKAEGEVRYMWRLLNGNNLSPKSPKFSEFMKIYNKDGATAMAQAMIEDGDSTLVASHIRTMFTPLAGREKSFTEASGDFVLGAMLSTIGNRPVDQMLLGDFTYSSNDDGGPTISSSLNIKTLDSSLTGLLAQVSKQESISDPNYRLGIITTQQYGKSIFSGGTNRRPIKKLAEDFLCKPVGSLMNFSISDRWVGRDIPRAPGNDSKVYLNRCMGCHTGLDSLRGAFAGYDFTDRLTWSTDVQPKLNNNPQTSPEGFVVKSDTWEHLGWLPIAPEMISSAKVRKYQKGPRPLIEMIVGSRDYYSCLTQQVKERLCRERKVDSKTTDAVVDRFQKHKLLKTAFAEVASLICLNSGPAIDGVSNRYQLVRQLEIATGVDSSRLHLNDAMLAKLPNSGRLEEVNGTFLRTWSQLAYSSCKVAANAGDLKPIILGIVAKKSTVESFIQSFYEKTLAESVPPDELKSLSAASVAKSPYDSVVSACSLILTSPKLYLIRKP